MRIGVAGVPGAWSTDRLARALENHGAESFAFRLRNCVHDLHSGVVCLGDEDLRRIDAVVVKKLDERSDAESRSGLHVLRALEATGVRVFSPADVIDVAMDRYRMTMRLSELGLPIPETVASGSGEGIARAVGRLGESVVKPIYTSKGRGMRRVGPGDAMPPESNGYQLAQRFVEAPGRDIGATVIGGRFAEAFYRVATDGEWMTTTAAGGRYTPCELTATGIHYAERAARGFGLDYTVVDLVEHEGDYLLYEVSAFGGFRGLWQACGVDAAGLYADHIVSALACR